MTAPARQSSAVELRPESEAEPASSTPELLKSITSIGSPLALATALLFYFGWTRSDAQAQAFGADVSVFAMSTQDYLLRSVNVLFFPVILLLLLALFALWIDRKVRLRATRPAWLPTVVRVLAYSWALFLPLGLLLRGVAGTFGDVTLPFWVALSILGPTYAAVLRRVMVGDGQRLPRITVALLATLIIVVLFWQTERLARLGGDALADDIKDNTSARLPTVELFSTKDLNLAGAGVTKDQLPGTQNAYGYHYSGLYLLQLSGGKYFLLTDGWADDRGRLIVVPDISTIRVEFGN